MDTWVALVRGINVGGRMKIAMSELRDLLTGLGFADVRSLLQSGNLLFQCAGRSAVELEILIVKEVSDQLGMGVDFLVRGGKQWGKIVAKNPFPDHARHDPSHLAVMCLKDKPSQANVTQLENAISGREEIRAIDRELYIVYPDGIGRSKLTHGLIEKKLGTRGTARNWNTVLKIAEALGGKTS
jgi:uncharacterized protein (DUF1697 family)